MRTARKTAAVLLLVLFMGACAAAAPVGGPPPAEQRIAERWFVAHVNSHPVSYDRVRTVETVHDGQPALSTVTDSFALDRDGDALVLANTVEECTQPNGRLIRLRVCSYNVRHERRLTLDATVEVGPTELIYTSTTDGKDSRQTRVDVPEGIPVYASLRSFLLSGFFRKAGGAVQHTFLDATHIARNPRPCTIRPARKNGHAAPDAIGLESSNGALIYLSRDLDVFGITYSRTLSIFAAAKPDATLTGEEYSLGAGGWETDSPPDTDPLGSREGT